MNKIIVISGAKGGVGKSMVTIGVVDYLLARGERVTVVEADSTNPDVAKMFNGAPNVSICTAAMDDESGFIEAANAIENAEGYIVVNTAARGLAPLIEHWNIVRDVADSMSREIVIFFPINRQRDSLELLRRQIDGVQGVPVYAVLNTFFGQQEKFALFHGSKVKAVCSGAIVWPELNDRVADRLANERIRLDDADGHFTVAERSAIRRYRSEVNVALSGVI